VKIRIGIRPDPLRITVDVRGGDFQILLGERNKFRVEIGPDAQIFLLSLGDYVWPSENRRWLGRIVRYE
jgi:hypothetical protein